MNNKNESRPINYREEHKKAQQEMAKMWEEERRKNRITFKAVIGEIKSGIISEWQKFTKRGLEWQQRLFMVVKWLVGLTAILCMLGALIKVIAFAVVWVIVVLELTGII